MVSDQGHSVRTEGGLQKKVIWASVLVGFAALTLSGCRSHAERVRSARDSYYLNNLQESSTLLRQQIEKDPEGSDSDLVRLDLAVVELARANPVESERLLRQVRDRFDYLEQKSAAEMALATVTDDNRLAYPGEDYEKVLVRAFLALANLMDDGEDAHAYAFQVTDKQNQIIQASAPGTDENPKLRYKRLALGAYIQGLVREETRLHYDDAARSYEKVVAWLPKFQEGKAALERSRTGRHSRPGNGVVYVFGLVDRGPYKEQTVELPTTAALLVADQILSAIGKYTLPPTIAPVKVARVVVPPKQISHLGVRIGDRPSLRTETAADLGELAAQQYHAIYPQVIARAIVRRVVKKAIVVGTKSAIDDANSPIVNAALDIGGVIWEATEAADTRCWSLLPREIQVLRIELPEGEYPVSITPLLGTAPVGPGEAVSVRVVDGRNCYILANFANGRLIGELSSSPK